MTDPQSKKNFLPHDVKLFFGKVPNAQYCSSKIKCVRAKNRRGGGAFKAPPPPDRIGLKPQTECYTKVAITVRVCVGWFIMYCYNGNVLQWTMSVMELSEEN